MSTILAPEFPPGCAPGSPPFRKAHHFIDKWPRLPAPTGALALTVRQSRLATPNPVQNPITPTEHPQNSFGTPTESH